MIKDVIMSHDEIDNNNNNNNNKITVYMIRMVFVCVCWLLGACVCNCTTAKTAHLSAVFC